MQIIGEKTFERKLFSTEKFFNGKFFNGKLKTENAFNFVH